MFFLSVYSYRVTNIHCARGKDSVHHRTVAIRNSVSCHLRSCSIPLSRVCACVCDKLHLAKQIRKHGIIRRALLRVISDDRLFLSGGVHTQINQTVVTSVRGRKAVYHISRIRVRTIIAR